METPGILGIIPARKGSLGIPRKNLQPVNGRPLVRWAADTLAPLCKLVVVSTDDTETASIAQLHGYQVSTSFRHTDETTALEVAAHVAAEMQWPGPVVMLQPTSPFVDVAGFLAECEVRGLDSAVAGTPVTHQHWDQATGRPLLPRVNRQQLDGASVLMREAGCYFWGVGARVGSPPGVIVHSAGAGTDIDTPADLVAARAEQGRRRVLLLFDESREIGSGHRRRAEALAAAMPWHDCRMERTGPGFVWPSDWAPDLVVTDWLDTPRGGRPHPSEFGAWRWVTFEDLGPDAVLADAVVNALYPTGTNHRREYNGPDWAILRPEFLTPPPFTVNDQATRVLVMFGGTDPANLIDKTRQALAGSRITATYVGPGADEPVAALMHDHDLLVTSAGRTVYEAAAIGIPTYVLAANQREATHVHLGPAYGNVFGGLGAMVPPERIREDVLGLLGDVRLRREMSQRSQALIDGRGLERCVWLIDSLLKEL